MVMTYMSNLVAYVYFHTGWKGESSSTVTEGDYK